MIENRLKQILSDCLCEDVDESISINDIDSLDMLDIMFHIESEYNVSMHKKQMTNIVTFNDLVSYVENLIHERQDQ